MVLVTFLVQFEEDTWFCCSSRRQKNRRFVAGRVKHKGEYQDIPSIIELQCSVLRILRCIIYCLLSAISCASVRMRTEYGVPTGI